jgi:hypothetical protein
MPGTPKPKLVDWPMDKSSPRPRTKFPRCPMYLGNFRYTIGADVEKTIIAQE